MQFKIWRVLAQILSYRKDLIGIIKPFMENLNNKTTHKKYSINDEESIPFLKKLPLSLQPLITKNFIINEEKEQKSLQNLGHFWKKVEDHESDDQKVIREIIKDDDLEKLQKLIIEKDGTQIKSIAEPFNEVEMKIPILHYCLIKKATTCFKYLLLNGIEDPKTTMEDKRPLQLPFHLRFYANHPKNSGIYKWDCLAIAIYYGDAESMKILEELNLELGNDPSHIEAAILSYRNTILKSILSKTILFGSGIALAARNNNIKGVELLLNKGYDIVYRDPLCIL